MSQLIPVDSCVSSYNMSSDSDSDFSDAADSNPTEKDEHAADNVKTNKNGMKVRGKDLDWVEMNKFADANDYKNSDIVILKSTFKLIMKQTDNMNARHVVKHFH